VNRANIPPRTYDVTPFTVTISGQITVGVEETYTPTAEIPLKTVIALAVKKMGIQRSHFLNVLRESMIEVLNTDVELRSALVAESGLNDFEQLLKDRVLSQLPRKTRAGKVKAELTVAEVAPSGIII
jgi:hypothetical protein